MPGFPALHHLLELAQTYIKSEHPGLSIGDTAKKSDEMWSEQSAKDKQLHEQKSG